MSDFKVGDEVWWFEFPEQSLGLMKDIFLKSSIVCEAIDDKYIGVEACHSLHKFDIDLYRSKQDAIDAMINHIEKLRRNHEC